MHKIFDAVLNAQAAQKVKRAQCLPARQTIISTRIANSLTDGGVNNMATVVEALVPSAHFLDRRLTQTPLQHP